jgi:hypothetical protein
MYIIAVKNIIPIYVINKRKYFVIRHKYLCVRGCYD